MIVVGRLEEREPENRGDQQVHANQGDVANVATGHKERRDSIGQEVHVEILNVKARPAHAHPQIGVGRQDDGLKHHRDEHEGVGNDCREHERLVDVEQRRDDRGATERFVFLRLGKKHVESQRERGALAADHDVASNAVGVDIRRGKAGGICSHILGKGGLLDGLLDGREDPAGDAEEIEGVHDERNRNSARERLSKAGDGRQNDRNGAKDVNLKHVGEKPRNEKRQQDGDDVIEPVLDKVGDHAVLREERHASHALVDEAHDKAHNHGGEHTACAELGHLKNVTVFSDRRIHAQHEGAYTGETGNHAAVLAIFLNRDVVRNDKRHKQANETEAERRERRRIGERRDKTADDVPKARDCRNHREGNDVEDRV